MEESWLLCSPEDTSADAKSGLEALMTEGYGHDPLQRSKARAIERVAEHLNSLHSLLEGQAGGRSRTWHQEIMAHLDRAGGCLGGIYEGRLPSSGRIQSRTVRFHLQAANALAEEHLCSEGEEGKARLALKRALSAYERGG